jgi:predicted nucleic acid-binding protein
VLYWDASGILSTLFEDEHTAIALKWAQAEGEHLLSSLAYAEVCAVISRMHRAGSIDQDEAEAALTMLEQGSWRRTTACPEWDIVPRLSTKWPLRGADLWHLTAAKGLQGRLPELQMVTFDARLGRAAREEGLIRERSE